MKILFVAATIGVLFPFTAHARQDAKELCPVVEVAVGKLKEGADVGRFLADSRGLDPAIAKMKGFISRRFYESAETGQYIDIVCWKSAEDARRAEQEVHNIPACNAYLSHYRETPDLFILGKRK